MLLMQINRVMRDTYYIILEILRRSVFNRNCHRPSPQNGSVQQAKQSKVNSYSLIVKRTALC